MQDIACHINVYVPSLDDPGFEAALADLAQLGYSRVVLSPMAPDTDVAPLRSAFETAGLTPVTLAVQDPEADVSSADADIRQRGVDSLLAAVELTKALGSDQMNGVPYGLFGRADDILPEERIATAAQLVGQVAERAKDDGIVVNFEVLNRYETSMLNTAAQAVEFVQRSGSDNLRIHLDTFHMAVEEADMAAAVTHAAAHLGYLELGQSGRGLISAGAADNRAVLEAAKAAGYAGPVGVEAFTRNVVGPMGGSMLAIWRDTYPDGHAVAADAMTLIREVLG